MPPELPAFIIDNNLPKNISLWQGEKFIHVFDLASSLSDTKIWKYAIEHKLIIISKDADFSYRVLQSSYEPKFIFIRIGNCSKGDLENFIRINWDKILHLINYYRIVEVYFDHIEGIR